MFNVYPQRATDPNAMDTTFNRALHEQNMAAFRYVLGQYAPGNRPAVWAAWGTLIEKRPYLFDALEEMLAIGEEYHAQWLTFGPRSRPDTRTTRCTPARQCAGAVRRARLLCGAARAAEMTQQKQITGTPPA